MNEWISVAERMPEPDTECIVWSPGNAQHGPYAEQTEAGICALRTVAAAIRQGSPS